MPNQFFIDPNMGRNPNSMQGLGQAIQGYGERKRADAATTQQDALRQEALSVFQERDPNKVAAFTLANPQYSQAMKNSMGIVNAQQESEAKDFTRSVLSNPEGAKQAFETRIQSLQSQGRDAKDTIQSYKDWLANPEAEIKDLELVFAGLADEQEWKAYQGGDVSAKEEAETVKLGAEAKKIEAETRNLITPRVKPEDKLKAQKLQLEIENQQAAVTERKQKAINAAEQKDQTSMAQAFEASGAITNIDDLLKDDAFEDIYGVGDNMIPTFWSGAVALEAKRDQLVGLLSLESRQKLKGQGTISEGEAKTLGQSATVLSNAGIDEVTAKNELLKVRNIFKRAEKRAMKNPAAKAAIETDRQQNELLKQLPEGSLNNGDGTFTMPDGTIVEPE